MRARLDIRLLGVSFAKLSGPPANLQIFRETMRGCVRLIIVCYEPFGRRRTADKYSTRLVRRVARADLTAVQCGPAFPALGIWRTAKRQSGQTPSQRAEGLAQLFMSRAESLNLTGAARDAACVEFFVGAAALAKQLHGEHDPLAVHLIRLCHDVIAVRGYPGLVATIYPKQAAYAEPAPRT